MLKLIEVQETISELSQGFLGLCYDPDERAFIDLERITWAERLNEIDEILIALVEESQISMSKSNNIPI